MNDTRRLLHLARSFDLPLAMVILFGLTGGLLSIWQAALLSRVINNVFLEGQPLGGVQVLLLSITLIVLIRSLLVWGSEINAGRLAVGIKNNLREFLFSKIMCLGPAYTRLEQTGELANTLTQGVEALDAYFSQYLPQLVIAALLPLAILVFVFPRDPLSGLVLLLTGPLIPLFMYLIGKNAEKLTQRQWGTLSLLGAHFLDSLQGLQTLKEFGRSGKQAASINAAGERFRDITLKVLRITFLSALVLELVGTLSTAIIAVEIGLRLLYGLMGFQEALFLLLLAPEFYLPLRMLGLRFHAGMAGTAAARRIFQIMDAEEMGSADSSLTVDKPFNAYDLRVANVSFTYSGATSPALKEINLEVKTGEHVALVGPTGAGKSTLAALLLGFMLPSTGRISLNGIPLDPQTNTNEEALSLAIWRKQFAWVPQNPYIFHDTLAANLRLGKANATQTELESAARRAYLDDTIASLPQGYETTLGEAGARLSSGEAQRLALARAFLKDAPVLILDETTSSLDPESETRLTEATHQLKEGRTVITIAHRLNTVFKADRIFVLDEGNLIETGDHHSLLAAGGVYSNMVGIAGETPFLLAPPQAAMPAPEQYHELAHVDPFEFEKQDASLPIILRLLSFLHGSWGGVALSVLLGVLTVGSNVGLMATSAFLISTAALHPGLGALQVAIVGVRFFGLSRGIFRYTERLVSHNISFRLLAKLRSWFYSALEPLAPARLMQFHAGDLLARVIADVETLENFYVRAVAPPLAAVVAAALMALFFGSFHARLAWIYLALMILLGLFLPFFSWYITRRPAKEMVDHRASLESRLVDGLQGLPDLLAYDGARAYAAEINLSASWLNHSQLRLASISGFSSALVLCLTNLGMLAVLTASISLVIAGVIPGTMLAVVALAALAGFEAVMPLPQSAQSLSSCSRSAQRLFSVVDSQPAVIDPLSPCECPGSTNPSISISGLCFKYSGAEKDVLSGIELELSPGKRLAVVGPSGAGKSTLANLLMRFWEYDRGSILLNDRELCGYSQEDVRSLISIVPQRSHFFNASIRENLLLARPRATDKQMQEAAHLAQVDNFIQELPHGYDTLIGEHGLLLSGGERQRLALARAFMKDAPIYLLDEPTANLDPFTEKALLQALFSSTKGRSLILITHRLVQLEYMDEIIGLDKGRIVERGTQKELLARGGLFRRMWESERRILLDRNSPKTACGPRI